MRGAGNALVLCSRQEKRDGNEHNPKPTAAHAHLTRAQPDGGDGASADRTIALMSEVLCVPAPSSAVVHPYTYEYCSNAPSRGTSFSTAPSRRIGKRSSVLSFASATFRSVSPGLKTKSMLPVAVPR